MVSHFDKKTLETFMIPLLAGAAARCTAAVILAPMDVVKTRMQFRGEKGPVYSSVRDAVMKIWERERIRGFYHGLPTRLMYVAPAAAISFAFYEQFKFLLHKRQQGDKSSLNPLIPLAAGGLARVMGTASRTPFDIARQRLQVQDTLRLDEAQRYSGTLDVFRKILRREGISSLFAGYSVTLMRDAPFAAIYFLTYETMKEVQRWVMGSPLHTGNHLVAGALAGGVSALCTAPFDVVKTRLQTQRIHGMPRYTGVRHAFLSIYREEGPAAFLRGLGPRLLMLMPAASITFACYEKYVKLLQSRFPDVGDVARRRSFGDSSG